MSCREIFEVLTSRKKNWMTITWRSIEMYFIMPLILYPVSLILTQQFTEDDTDIGQTYCRMLSLTWACIAFYLHTNAQVQQSIPALKMRLGKHSYLQTCKYFICLCHANTCATISIFDKMKGKKKWCCGKTPIGSYCPIPIHLYCDLLDFFAIPFEIVI